MIKVGAAGLATILLLGGCQAQTDDRHRASVEVDIDDAIGKFEDRADRAGDKFKAFAKDLRRDASRTADEVDFDSRGNPPVREE